MEVTIVTNDFSEEAVKNIQKEVNNLINVKKYSLRQVLHYLGLKMHVSAKVSHAHENEVTINCKKN